MLDVARYITDVTAQLEAVAIAAHLDRLAYFLGMAKAESEILLRINGVLKAQRAEDESREPTVDAASREQFVRLRIARFMFSGARAQGDLVAQISDAPGQFEFGAAVPHRVPKILHRLGQLVERDGEGPNTATIRLRAASASSPGRFGRRLRIAP